METLPASTDGPLSKKRLTQLWGGVLDDRIAHVLKGCGDKLCAEGIRALAWLVVVSPLRAGG